MQRVRALQRAQITHNHTGRPIVEWSAWQRLQLEGGWGGEDKGTLRLLQLVFQCSWDAPGDQERS